MVSLPQDSKLRKEFPIVTGVLDYFPEAIAVVAFVSYAGNQKHNPGQPLHWSRGKSDDHVDCEGRHLIERGGFDLYQVNGRAAKVRHSGQKAWRALAALQIELETAAAAEGITIAQLLEREWGWPPATDAVRERAVRHTRSGGVFDLNSGQGTRDTSPTPIMGPE